MNYLERCKIYENLLEIYGNLQLIKTIEEFSELNKELCHYLSDISKFDENNLLDEIADAEIMIEQIKLFFKIDHFQIEKRKEIKLDRVKCDLLEK